MNQKTSYERLPVELEKARKKSSIIPYRLQYDPHKKSSSWWIPIVSVAVALVISAIFILLNGMNPITVYSKMFTGAFGSSFGISETFVKAIPLLLCGLGVAIAYRISIWNIGAEGQFVLGAIGATAMLEGP